MCGICGMVGRSALKAGSEGVVLDMMDCLRHRGPDDEGLAKGREFIFGHRRLAIIDPEHGRQPMVTEDGKVTLVFNGEIYNYKELRSELMSRGAVFKTHSDGEVLLRLYEMDGEKCLDRINGMFAFAVFDKRKGRFFAARDHFGIKPFYYYVLPDKSILFASEIKAILQHPSARAVIDYDAVKEYLTFQFCLGDKTLFKGIKKLEPAHMLSWRYYREEPLKVAPYWKETYNIETGRPDSYFLDRLSGLLEDSIKQQLRSDVPVGAYTSGGLDSSIIASLAGKRYGKRFQCFHGRFREGAKYDESEYARILAKSIGAEFHDVVPTARDFVKLMPTLIYHMDEPMAGPGLFPQFMVSKLASKKVKVVLGGQGGDEIFGGYTRYLIAYLEQCIKGAIYETVEEGRHIVALDSIIQNLPSLKEYAPLLKEFWSEGLFDPMHLRYFKLIDRSPDLKHLLSPEMNFLCDKDRLVDGFASAFNSPSTKSYINKMLNFDKKTLLPALLHIEDRMSMAASIESRVPLLDYRIVELVNTMPPALKFKKGKLKYSLYAAGKKILPKAILNRRDKMGFPVPLKEWTAKGPVRDFICDILLCNTSRARGVFNVKEIEKLLNTESNYGRQIWGALCLELWFGIFIDKGR
ncbi:MAG: asparagine synthase (glutamine-hydrolyzing) [Candidatus Omnitrophica bacterium]|nr:asparagine synthase (glutamine-hydrolyzing) [Candidatus Omnitrophota bacterium]MDD5681183.1 asparagine synthase (glutamine-hydrolyzing) [Candidatus Omnitrophota bacterium]